ncbi:multidrug transporter [Pontibacter diazotrophicus]|uniref:multidrug transporter n=1 Tax=Pontibacter diazotrophicus TaxID=1400979 RepID=UPI0015F19840|nr:multidrug transporter [Pontibacter diazotrophicus]
MLNTPPNQPTAKHSHVIKLFPMIVAKALAAVVLVLMLAYIAGMVYEKMYYPEPSTLAYRLIRGFDMNWEENVPAFFSTAILLLASLLLFAVYHLKSSYKAERRKWGILSIVFLFMAVDESLQIHEYVSEVVRPMLVSDLSGLLYWAWVVPYGVLVLAAVAFFLPFVWSLPLKTRTLFITSGAMFVAGALGLELFEGYFYVRYGYDHIYNLVLYCMEEVLEMSGVVLFIYALLDYMVLLKAQVLFVPGKHKEGLVEQLFHSQETDVAARPKV